MVEKNKWTNHINKAKTAALKKNKKAKQILQLLQHITRESRHTITGLFPSLCLNTVLILIST